MNKLLGFVGICLRKKGIIAPIYLNASNVIKNLRACFLNTLNNYALRTNSDISNHNRAFFEAM